MTKLLSRWAVALLCAVLALLLVDPAFAQVAAATALSTNAGLWTFLHPYLDQILTWAIGLLLSFLSLKAYQWFGVSISATQEERLRQTALTGADLAIRQGEAAIDRAGLVPKVVDWMKEREPAIIAKLGFSDQVLSGIALKMVSAAIASAAVEPAAALPAPAIEAQP